MYNKKWVFTNISESTEEYGKLQKPFAEFAAENIDKFQLLIDELVEIANHYVPGWDSDTNNFTL